ncbi:hypothetical protein HU750_08585 [Pseudomonas sp. SWRI50]|uniref:hypothetical protein n=1 Tax=Pseudomonas sp. SWRI50 TaxID=2745484 RepID=UPI0016456366|nr:hypothetical protein [Pseudomonas sp. SWRI50]MBC3485727.1 hypothetical protein [Pseudomonas sp. SWRI50]
MKTLGEIIEAAKSGERPDYDDLRLAVCAMDMLMTFDRQAIWKLAEGEEKCKKPFLTWSGLWQRDENFTRVKRAMAMDPKAYLGANYDPDSPAVQERRRMSIAIMDGVASRAQGKQP